MNLNFTLLKHQVDGVDFLITRKAGLLAFEQGLGKTLVAIEAFRDLWKRGLVERMVVVCPNSLKRNWVSEIQKFAPELGVQIAEGKPKQRRETLAYAKAPVVVTSFETSRAEVTGMMALLKRASTVLTLDESHAAKNWQSQTSRAMRHFAPLCEYRWLLSGTPVTNTAKDIYTQIAIMSPNRNPLGSLEAFSQMTEDGKIPINLQAEVDKLVMRRTKEQCLDLPEKTHVDVHVELPPWQRKLYNDMRDDMVCEIRAMTGEQFRAFAPTALSKITRLSQIASNPGLLMDDIGKTPAKYEALDGLLNDILSVPGRKVIIWSGYIKTIEELMARYQSHGCVAIYGAVEVAERQAIAKQFQEDPATRIMLANPAAAGTGFTLTAANYTIYESTSWRYDHYAQSQDRNHRIGQTDNVTYMRLVAVGTIEEAIGAALERKRQLAGSILGDGDTGPGISQLSQKELCAVLMGAPLPVADRTRETSMPANT